MRRKRHSSARLLRPGDTVTLRGGKWGSDTEVIGKISTDRHGNMIALFVGGGFWRMDLLVRV